MLEQILHDMWERRESYQLYHQWFFHWCSGQWGFPPRPWNQFHWERCLPWKELTNSYCFQHPPMNLQRWKRLLTRFSDHQHLHKSSCSLSKTEAPACHNNSKPWLQVKSPARRLIRTIFFPSREKTCNHVLIKLNLVWPFYY